MSLEELLERNHVYKRRIKKYSNTETSLQWGSMGIGSSYFHRLELVYLRLFKSIFRRKFLRATTMYFKPSYRIFIHPNFLLTAKSKNSRMGCGVGLLVRSVVKLSAGQIFLECIGYSLLWLIRVYTLIRYRYPYRISLIIRRDCSYSK